MTQLEEQVREEFHALAEALRAAQAVLARRLGDFVRDAIDSLADDQALSDLLIASAEGNLTSIVHVLRHEIDPSEVDAPLASMHWARRLAQRGIHVDVVARAYRVGQRDLMTWFYEILEQRNTDQYIAFATYTRLNSVIATYADRATEQTIIAYDEEAQRWQRSAVTSLAARVRSVLDGDPLDVSALEQALGYELRQRHIGIVMWIPGKEGDDSRLVELERTAGRVARRITPNARPLVVARDEASAYVWLPLGEESPDQHDLVEAIEPLLSNAIRAALGDQQIGADGFRLTMREALTAQSVVLPAGEHSPRIIPFAEVAPISLLVRDSNVTKAWVLNVLGGLAGDDDHAAGLRETLRIYLATSCSLPKTASRLVVHKNTVTYRVRKAEELRGRPLSHGRLQLELALLACHWLGPAALERAVQPY